MQITRPNTDQNQSTLMANGCTFLSKKNEILLLQVTF